MKNIFKIFLTACITLFIISCSRDDEKATFNNTSAATLKADASNVVLIKDNNAKKAVTFSWVNPAYNPSLVAKNQLEIALKGTDFKNPKTIEVEAGSTSMTYTVLELNQLLLSMNLPFSANEIEVRLKSYFPSVPNIQPIYSAPIKLTVTPYALISYLYAVGAFQGWDINNAQALVSATSNGIYIGYLNFKEANSEFLVVPVKGSYDNKFGSNDNLHLIKGDGNNLKAVNSGSQKITVDVNALTFKLEDYSWAMLGTAIRVNGYDGPDSDLIYNSVSQKWEITLALIPGDFKFRFNNKWDLNYGDDGNNGSLEAGGKNIPITEAGTYKITFDEVNLVWTKTKM